MNGLNLLPVFVVGLAGSVHCVGMCGGIAGALSGASAPRARSIPIIALHTGTSTRNIAAYNAGRIGSYMLAGAIAGGLAGGAASLARVTAWQTAGYWLANLMLVALGLYLMDAWHGLVRLEAAGNALWRRLLPLLKPLLPADTPFKMLGMGALWGWVPCGMVYSVLLTAALSGSASSGAAVMLAFGLGTLPMLLTLGLLGARVRTQLQRRPVRIASGLLVLAFGMLGLMRAAGIGAPLLEALGLLHTGGAAHAWLDAFCVGARP
jgi:sulfite exporter TauE/SafE